MSEATPEDIRKAARKLFWAANSMEKNGDGKPDEDGFILAQIVAALLFPGPTEMERRRRSVVEKCFWNTLDVFICESALGPNAGERAQIEYYKDLEDLVMRKLTNGPVKP